MRYDDLFEAPRRTLPLQKSALPNARGSRAALLAVMAPSDFLRLTTEFAGQIDIIAGHAFPSVDEFDKGAMRDESGDVLNKSQYYLPYLHVYYPSGRVSGHEGRHRAAMIMKAGGTSFPVAIYFFGDISWTLQYQRTNYGVEPEESEKFTETFTNSAAMKARQSELERLNRDMEQPFSYGYFNDEALGGQALRGNPERRDPQNPWAKSPWQPSDMPAVLTGQYDHSVAVPTSRMRVGRIK